MNILSSQVKDIVRIVDAMGTSENEVALILLAEENHADLFRLRFELNKIGAHYVGGLFPAVISGQYKSEEGTVIQKLPVFARPEIVKGINGGAQIPESVIEWKSENINKPTILTLLDGLTGNISQFLYRLYDVHGNNFSYVGGGAGSLSLKQNPCIFCNEGVFEDCALLVPVNLESKLGIRHGWQKVMGPITATKTKNTVISELNWRKAFEFYREVVEKDSRRSFDDEDFFDIAKCYPFGMKKGGKEAIVRDPISVNSYGELKCVGEVAENSELYILKGVGESLINAAGKAAIDGVIPENTEYQMTLIFDCISRVIFLGDNFERELEAIMEHLPGNGQDAVPAGALTLGEIATFENKNLEFFNKTVVVDNLYK